MIILLLSKLLIKMSVLSKFEKSKLFRSLRQVQSSCMGLRTLFFIYLNKSQECSMCIEQRRVKRQLYTLRIIFYS